jgi:hypothetical protein
MAAVADARAARTKVVAQLLTELTPTEVATIEAALPGLERIIGHI